MSEETRPEYRVALLGSPLTVIRAERLLKEQGLAVKAMPLPRHISSECGICLRFTTGEEERVRSVLKASAVHIVNVYDMRGQDFPES